MIKLYAKRLYCLLPLTVLALGSGVACKKNQGTSSDEKVLEKNVIYRLPLEDKQLILTFDDGPGEKTPQLLDFLKAKNIKATFFVVGRIARYSKAILERMHNEGHIVANHTVAHELPMPSGAKLLSEIMNAHAIIQPFTKTGVYFFRPPGGSWDSSDALTTAVPALQKYVGPIYWDIGGELSGGHSADWACWAKGLKIDECAAGYVREVEKRRKGIVLMHDNHSRTVDMFINHFYPAVESRGYKFIQLDQNKAISERLNKYAGKPLGGEGISYPDGQHPPADVTINPPAPKPCTEHPTNAMFDDAAQKFSLIHGIPADPEQNQAIATNIPDTPAKDPKFNQKWFVRHSASDVSNITFSSSSDGNQLNGIRYNISYAQQTTVSFQAKWNCNKWEGSLSYPNGVVEQLIIETI